MSDQEYIKMILALPEEFFKDWTWNAGDRAILLDDHYKREVLIINTHSQIVSSRIAKLLFPGSLEVCKTEEHITRLRPLPSQEQLQDIIKSNFKNNGLVFEDRRENLYLEWRFEAWLRDQIFEEKTGLSFKCLWLAFLMEAVYEKRWNGDSWEKEK